MKVASGQTILFTGDSITDCGRERPVGYGNGLGDGYVALVDAIMSAGRPDYPINVLNTGISGDRVIDLEARWQTDVMAIEKDWLSIMIGINDVWRQFDCVKQPVQVDIARYESTYRDLLKQARPSMKGLIIMTPYMIEPDLSDPRRVLMDEYGAVTKRLAGEFDALFINTQAAFDAYLTEQPAESVCADRIHPNMPGHMIIANAFLTGVEFA